MIRYRQVEIKDLSKGVCVIKAFSHKAGLILDYYYIRGRKASRDGTIYSEYPKVIDDVTVYSEYSQFIAGISDTTKVNYLGYDPARYTMWPVSLTDIFSKEISISLHRNQFVLHVLYGNQKQVWDSVDCIMSI